MSFSRTGTAFGFLGALLYACASSEAAPPASEAVAEPDALSDLSVADLADAQLETLDGGEAALRVLMTDAPVDAEHVYVTLCKVQVHAGVDAPAEGADESVADAGVGASELAVGDAGSPQASPWWTVYEGCRTFDLLALRDGVTTELGLDTLPPGRYGQIRLAVSEASIVVDGEEHPLTVPSGARRGIQIVHRFELVAGELTTLALDFDAARSIHETGGNGYILRPVITALGTRHEPFADLGAESDAGRGRRPAHASPVELDAGAPADAGAGRPAHAGSGRAEHARAH